MQVKTVDLKRLKQGTADYSASAGTFQGVAYVFNFFAALEILDISF